MSGSAPKKIKLSVKLAAPSGDSAHAAASSGQLPAASSRAAADRPGALKPKGAAARVDAFGADAEPDGAAEGASRASEPTSSAAKRPGLQGKPKVSVELCSSTSLANNAGAETSDVASL